MELEQVIAIVTIIVSYLLGLASKKCTFIKDEMIPMQNIVVGLVITIIYWIITKDFSAAIATSGILAGGAYDVIHNLDKMIHKKEDE